VAPIARKPDRCAGLLLTNAISYDSWPIPSVKAMQKLGPALHRLPDAVVQSFLRMFLARGHQDSQRGHEAMELYWPMYARHGAADALARQVRSLRTADTLASRTATPACRCRPASCGGRPTGNDLVAAMS
jgi:hypothetical protein